MVKFASNAWQTLSSNQVWKQWTLGVLDGLFRESGILDDHPLTSFLEKFVLPMLPPKRKFVLAAADVDSGSYIRFTEQNSSDFRQVVKMAVSSASIPFVFPNQQWP